MNKHATQIPQHLPGKLAICFYVWPWIFEDAYADLDKAMSRSSWISPSATATGASC